MGIFSFFQNPQRSSYEKIKGGGQLPVGDWRRSSQLLSVKGIQFRRASALKYAKCVVAADRSGGPFGLLIEREPNNDDDENALKAVGWCGSQEIHLGYVEREEAARHAERYPGVPLAGEFYSLYLSANDYIDIRFFLCIPEGVRPKPSARIERLFDYVQDELTVLIYLSMADGMKGRLEGACCVSMQSFAPLTFQFR